MNRLEVWFGMCVPAVETVDWGDGNPGCPGRLAHGFNRGMMKTDKSVR